MFKFLPRLSNMVAAIAIAAAVIALIAQENHEWVSSAIQYLETHNPIITAIATALLACVTGGLVWMAYLQIKTTRAQLRAYVFPESASLCDGSMLIPPNPAKANEPGVVFTWKNTGQTPASNVVSWGQIAVIEPINENRLTIPTLQNEFARHVGPELLAANLYGLDAHLLQMKLPMLPLVREQFIGMAELNIGTFLAKGDSAIFAWLIPGHSRLHRELFFSFAKRATTLNKISAQ